MDLIDFSGYERGKVNYGGSERKESILVPNGDGTFSDYMLKFRKKTPFGARCNHVSEYVGSHIFELLGFNVQKTFLGTFEGEEVVACKSFVEAGEQFVPFNDVGESTLDQDKERYQYEYADIMQMLRDNSKLTDVSETIAMFWEMFIVDALIGNFDRHGLNWGFVKRNGAYSLAPVFDNGSTKKRCCASSARKRKREPACTGSPRLRSGCTGGKARITKLCPALSSTSATEPCARS